VLDFRPLGETFYPLFRLGFTLIRVAFVSDNIPFGIREAFKNADWYEQFRSMRDALTHSDVGSCHLDEETGKVRYMHSKLGTDRKALVVEDIFDHVEKLFQKVNIFLGKVFAALNETLIDEETWQLCGFFGGRVYSRFVRPIEVIDFHSGRCEAYEWFEKEENPCCPFSDVCGAYKNRYREPGLGDNSE